MIQLVLIDEINCFFLGLKPKDITYIIDKTKMYEQGYHQSVAFKLKQWDGKVSLFGEDGRCFQYMISEVIDILDRIGYDVDSIEVIDEREFDDDLTVPLVDKTYLKEESGYDLRTHQVEGINKTITHKKGVLEYATSAGKSLISLGIIKSFDPVLPSLTVVPTEQLAKQTYKDYANSDLDVFLMTKDIKPNKRAEKFDKHRHIVITSKLLYNCVEFIRDRSYVLVADEIHQCGPVMLDTLSGPLSECPVRIGLTGTVPKDKLKKHKIFCHIGDGVLDDVSAKYLIDNKYASDVHIDMLKVRHKEMEEIATNDKDWEWEKEARYLASHPDRIEEIASYIKTLPKKNTIVLCHPQLGKNMCKFFDGRMVVDETPIEQRREWLSVFDEEGTNDHLLFCSYATSSTGLSYDHIYRVILIDPGPNETRIRQSIGRGMRLDGEHNSVEVLDISSVTKYSDRHYKERRKIYKREHFSFKELDYELEIE